MKRGKSHRDPLDRHLVTDRLATVRLVTVLLATVRLATSILATVLLITFFPSCQEKIDWELEMENELRLVVQAKITNERKAHEVKLSLPVYEINGMPEPVSGAEVFLSDGDGVIQLLEDPETPGTYLTDPDVQGVINRVYQLGIRVGEYEFGAVAQMEAVTPIRTPGYYMVQEDPPLYEIFFGGDDEPSMVKLEMDWSMVPGYDTLPAEENHAIIYGFYFDQLTVDVNELFSPARDRVAIPPGTQVIITKESLSDGYAEYIRGMLSETSWNGGLFDVKPGDPFDNLSAGAIGYFAATTVLRDTVTFKP